jgi:hypothetical protein
MFSMSFSCYLITVLNIKRPEMMLQTYSRDWTETVQDFHQKCTGHQPHESSLHACLQEGQ